MRLFFLFLTTCTAFADFKIPAGVFRMADRDKAVDLAAEKKLPLVTVWTIFISDDKERQDILADALKAASDLGVTVMAVNDEVLQLPPLLHVASEIASELPIVIISTPEGDKVWKIIATEDRTKNRAAMKTLVDEGIRDCRPGIKAWFSASPPHGPQMPGEKEIAWPLKEKGTSVLGVFARATAEGLYFKGSDLTGAPSYKMEELSPATRRYLLYLASAGADKQAPAAAMEKWTNTKGQTIEAAFVSLKDNKITLRTAAGKVHTFNLDTLAPESQTRAKTLSTSASEDKKPK